jgi:ABC-type nitrate/sulfonate/bicarbonate transport system substrate-binding protein
MTMNATRMPSRIAALVFAFAALVAPARAADTVLVGSVDANTANLWPLYIAEKNGYFGAAGLKLETVFSQSNASVIQQLAAGSFNIAPSAGIVDPIRANEKGAPVSILRILIQSPPYALLAKPGIKTIKDLKGKTIMIGGPKDVTRIFTDRMLEPNGLKSGDYDYVFAGATSARFSALKSGAVDAAILTVPFNFYAESAGYTNLGFVFDYIPDMPFAAMAVNRNWATANPKVVQGFLDGVLKGVTWFYDANNKAAAIKVMLERTKLKEDDIARSYDFLHDKKLFEPTGKLSKARVNVALDALKQLGDIPAGFPVDKLFLPGVTQVVD